MTTIVRVVSLAPSGPKTPHAGRYVVAWNPHTKAGEMNLEVTTTDDPREARRFEGVEALVEWNTVSRVQSTRPWDRKPNRPLTALTVEMLDADEVLKNRT